ncbi:MAG: hypothetical protein DWQ10_14235 [Calditrichaeota bacterium]|nr:MAG: hypothetical protein DWQ10_14235 [Calditrichota bacterium]
MKKNKLLNILLSFTIMIQAAFFQVAIPNLVLCFSGNDHIAFEWQDKDGLCAQENPVNQTVFNTLKYQVAETPETNCTDIDLHFHPSFAHTAKKSKLSSSAVNTIYQHPSLSVAINDPSSVISLLQTTPFNPIIGMIENTVLII